MQQREGLVQFGFPALSTGSRCMLVVQASRLKPEFDGKGIVPCGDEIEPTSVVQ